MSYICVKSFLESWAGKAKLKSCRGGFLAAWMVIVALRLLGVFDTEHLRGVHLALNIVFWPKTADENNL